jgi:hypothetical protein
MKPCAYCGKENSPAAVHCAGCGTAFPRDVSEGAASATASKAQWVWPLVLLAIGCSIVGCVAFAWASVKSMGPIDSGPLPGYEWNQVLLGFTLLLPNVVAGALALKAMGRAMVAGKVVVWVVAVLAALMSVMLDIGGILIAIQVLV